jgi:hypothetical protein
LDKKDTLKPPFQAASECQKSPLYNFVGKSGFDPPQKAFVFPPTLWLAPYKALSQMLNYTDVKRLLISYIHTIAGYRKN